MGQMGSAPFASTRRRRRDGGAFSPLALFGAGEAGGWWDPSDLTPEKVSWRRNLLTYSEQFDDASWAKVRSTITANATTAPDGSTTADKIVQASGQTSQGNVNQTVAYVAGARYTLSVFVKASEKTFCTLADNTADAGGAISRTWFNLGTGVVGTTSAQHVAAIQNVGNGWYRCSITFTANNMAAARYALCYVADSDNSIPVTDSGGIFAWGAQLEAAPTASSYQRITDFTSDFLAAFPQHALYQDSAGTTPVTALGQPVGLVLDKSKGLGSGALGFGQMGRRNLLSYSEQFDNAYWSQSNTTVTANATVAPSGAITADRLVENTATTPHVAFRTVTFANTAYTYSIYVEKASTRNILLYLYSASGFAGGVLNVATGVATVFAGSIAGTTVTVRNEGLFWWLSVTATMPATAGNAEIYMLNGTTVSYAGDGTSFIGIWGVQLEAASTASSYQRVTDTWYNAVPGSHLIQATSASRPTCDARVNLLTYSEQFDNAVWTKYQSSVTANAAVAPDGTTTADKLIPNTSNLGHALWLASNVTVGSGTSYTASAYVKAAEYGFAYINCNVGSFYRGASVNLTTGAITGVASGATATITSVGNGWYRVAVTTTVASSSGSIEVWALASDPASGGEPPPFAGNGTSGILVWGADLRLASDASLPYQRVVTASDYADVQAPRYLTFDGIDDSLYTAASVDFATWTSGTRRNLLTYPSAFDNAAWVVTTGGGVTANTGVAPNGTTTADVLFAGSTGSFRGVYQVFTAANVAYTASVYAKASGKPSIGFVDYNGSGRAVQFDLTNGTISSAAVAGYTASIETIGNGWYRCSITATPAAGTRYVQVFIGDTGTSTTVTASGSDGVLVWGAQLELGSTATAFQDVGTDKVSVFTGVRKLSDAAAYGIIAELGNRNSTQAGSFSLTAPADAASATYASVIEGSSVFTYRPATFAAPITNTFTALFDIGATTREAENIPRINGVVEQDNPQGAADAGTGTFGTYVLFIGRRNNASLPFNGRIYQLIVRGAQTDTATVQQTERFVAGKTGVVLP